MGPLFMNRNVILTLTGPDRIGIVDELTGLLLERGGNVETSRMARLGGEFAVLMLVSLPGEQLASLDTGLQDLTGQGYKVTITQAERTYAQAHSGWRPYHIEVHGADHEGIIHEVAHYLSERGISIESGESETTLAPISGSPLFAMTAEIVVPPSLTGQRWKAGLDEIGSRLNLEIRVSDPKDE
jgi:glycine cleavage system transcriptional repressor